MIVEMQAAAVASTDCAAAVALPDAAAWPSLDVPVPSDGAVATSCFATAAHAMAAAAVGMQQPPLTMAVEHGISSCFQLFSARSHAELISSVSARLVCVCMVLLYCITRCPG